MGSVFKISRLCTSPIAAVAIVFFAASSRGTDTNELSQSIQKLKQLPFEELVGLEVTTVARQPERLVNSPSAVQVITSEEIRRSGATSLPEALRLAPNLQVAQVDSRQWAISARGFNSTTANKLLVLADGRSVYTPLFSGVFWDVQNVPLDDVDRIEVISGPGAALWGANAVNGVINVISKSADQTQGTLVSAGGGSFLRDFASVRYGDRIGEDVYFRVYAMGFQREDTLFRGRRDATNDWSLGQFGFRGDWLPKQGDKITFQGDFYGGDMAQPSPGDTTVNGQNLVARWMHPFAPDSDMTLQAYWDRTWRKLPATFAEDLNTYDVDFQHRFPIGPRQRAIWGVGYRFMVDEVNNSRVLAFLPGKQDLRLVSAFVQDEITLVEDRLFLTLGSKFEHNDYSGFEVQPSGRLAFVPATNHMIWGAVSRAVRSPSRIDTEFFVPGVAPYFVRGSDRFDSEEVIAYELGYRTEVSERVGFSVSTFFNDYDNVRSVEPITGKPGQFVILNGLRAETYGVELSTTWQAMERCRLRGGYTFFKKHVMLEDSQDLNHGTGEGNDPHHQFLIQSMINLPANVEFDAVLRYVDNLNQRGPTVPAYMSLDLRVGWHVTRNLEISVVGQNLLDDQHPEFGPVATRQEIPRSVYGKVTWRF